MHNNPPNEIFTLLKKTPLFDGVTTEALQDISTSAYFVSFKKDEIIIKRGDIANDMFVIVEGSVRVYFLNSNQQETVITHLHKGDIFGEQGYLVNLIRSANVAATTDVKLIKIEYSILDVILKNSGKLRHYLEEINKNQTLDNFNIEFESYNKYFVDLFTSPRFINIYIYKIKSRFWRSLARMFFNIVNLLAFNQLLYKNTSMKKAVKGEVLFRKGDKFNYAYILLSGEVVLSFSEGVEDLIIKSGTLFGEIALLEKSPQTVTASCKANSTLIAIGPKDFLRLLANSSALSDLTSKTSRFYKLPRLKTTAFQMMGTFLDQDAVFTRYNMKGGKYAECIKIVSQPLFKMHIKTPKVDQVLTYKRGTFLFREIKLFNHRIVGLTSYGEWEEINILCELLLKEIRINPNYLLDFEKTGELLSSSLNEIQKSNSLSPSNIICTCMHVPKKVIQNLVAEGNVTLKDIAQKTGATTVCGACVPAIEELLGLSTTIYAIIEFNKQYNKNNYSFIIKPTFNNHLREIVAGQFANIYVHIENTWVERTYTVIPSTTSGQYEIFVKKFSNGVFSNWLIDNKDHAMLIKISHPMGRFLLKETQKPILCFASGIGITPFIAFIREIKNKNLQNTITIFYIVKDYSHALIPDDISEFISSNEKINLIIWEKDKSGFVTGNDVQNVVKAISPEFIYICGQLIFQNKLIQILGKLNFPSQNIFFETFIPS